MKQIFKIAFTVCLFAISQISIAQITSPYQVGTWPDFRDCAISYTYDDGCSGQFSKAIPIFNDFNFKLTLFTVSGWTGNWTNLQNAAANGHEVANHTATHPNLSTMTLEAQEAEIITSNELIITNVISQKSVTMATPYCAEGNDALASKYFIAVRGCQGYIESKTPANFMNVSSIICGDQGSVKTSANFKTQADDAAVKKGWLVYLIHGIDNDGGYSPLSSDTLRKSLEYLSSNNSKFWVNTFGNVARYIKERNCASVTETSASETTISVSITDTLSNNETFNFPLTIRRPLPDGWSTIYAKQNGNSISAVIVEVDAIKYIQFEAIPDAGTVVLSKSEQTGSNFLKGSLNNKELNIWINHNDLRFSIPKSCEKNPTVSIFNLKGIKLISYNNIAISEGIGNFCLVPISMQPGIYLFQLTNDQSVWTKKIHLPSI